MQLTAEWDWEVAEKVWKEEAWEEATIVAEKKNMLHVIRKLMNNLKISAEQAMDLLDIAEADREKYRCI